MRTPTPKVLSGVCNSASPPTVISGASDKWSARKLGTGSFMIRFAPDFKVTAMTANAYSGGAQIATVPQVLPVSNEAQVLIFTTAGAVVDGPFTFIATGA